MDLASALSTDDLQGSVTRVRFARLSRIRTILGSTPEELDIPFDASTFVEDDEHLIVDLVLNWVADGLLLCFFHAVRDKDVAANNDPTKCGEEWSNFCGTSNMPEEQIEALHHNISTLISPPPLSRYPPIRVFQLHTSSISPTLPDELVFSWPPPRTTTHESGFDGLYEADEYSDLMRGVDMDPTQLAANPGETRTNCTTRFGAKHSISSEHVYRHIESVFIPYGALIFCCFQTTKQVDLSPRIPASDAYALVSPPQDWSPIGGQNWHKQSAQERNGHLTPPYPTPPPRPALPSLVPPQHHALTTTSPSASYPSSSPGARFRSEPYGQRHALQEYDEEMTPPGGVNSRPLIRPPGDVECCRICGTLESPEWRRSEAGLKDLCNACGLRLARQVAKREGRQKPRKKKERA